MQTAYTPNIIPTKRGKPSKIKEMTRKKVKFFSPRKKIKRKFTVFSVNTRNISSHVLKISGISLVLRTREIINIFNTFDEIYHLQKVNIVYSNRINSNCACQTKIYDKRDDSDFDIVKFPFLDGDVPLSTSCGAYISQLTRFARVSSHVDDFNTRNKVSIAKLLRQGYNLFWAFRGNVPKTPHHRQY